MIFPVLLRKFYNVESLDDATRNSVFAIFIGFKAEITGKILKKRIIFSKNIIEMVRLQYHFSKTEFRDDAT